MTASDVHVVLPWIVKLTVVLGGLWAINIPVFQWIDVMFYGSLEAAKRARLENDRETAEIRKADVRRLALLQNILLRCR